MTASGFAWRRDAAAMAYLARRGRLILLIAIRLLPMGLMALKVSMATPYIARRQDVPAMALAGLPIKLVAAKCRCI